MRGPQEMFTTQVREVSEISHIVGSREEGSSAQKLEMFYLILSKGENDFKVWKPIFVEMENSF